MFLLDPSRLANFKPFLPRGWSGIFVCMGVEYIAFEGYEVIAEAGDEAIDPRRNLPKAILYSVMIVTVTYVLVAFGLIAGIQGTGVPAWEWLAGFGEKGFGEALVMLFPQRLLVPIGTYIAFLTVMFAATSALNATIFSAARVSYALGRDRMLPRGLRAHLGEAQHAARRPARVEPPGGRGHLPAHHRPRLRGEHHVPVPLPARQRVRAADAAQPRRGDAVRLPDAAVPPDPARGHRPAARPRGLHRERELARLGDRSGLDRGGTRGLLPVRPEAGPAHPRGDLRGGGRGRCPRTGGTASSCRSSTRTRPCPWCRPCAASPRRPTAPCS
ncbi:MAG: APC family permease [Desulfobacterales bacterium]|nr:APC family permease [Desulfobacterales bacterium]